MKVCVVGGGGREHALADVLSRTAEVVVTPGNAGIPGSTPEPVESIDADLYVIGPEAPLVDGLADRLRAAGRLVLGPGADGAALEGSKAFSKALLDEAGVPTAGWAAFGPGEEAAASLYLRSLPGPYVVKTDGLAAGKGVAVLDDRAEAEADVAAKLSGEAFGDAGRRVVIEEHMGGRELSVLALCDGRDFVVLPPARDHKRVGDGDTGPNTGGMGAYSPVAEADALLDEIAGKILRPTLDALARRGVDYRGVLYAGLMLTDAGPKVVEFNVRFGDPETQVVLPRLGGDVAALFAAAARGDLTGLEPEVTGGACVTVVLAAPGYPATPTVGERILGLDDAEALDGVRVYHAATRTGPGGYLYTGGGRVLDVTAVAGTLAEARTLAYRAAGKITWPGIHYRGDIAADA